MSQPSGSSRQRRPDGAALAIAAGLAVVSAVIFWNTANLGGGASYARIGPTAFPYAIATALALLAVGTAAKAWRGAFPERERDEPAPILWIVGGLAVQLLILKTAGFSIATGLLFAATARGFGRGPLWITVPVGIALSLAIWLVFARLLQLSLPAGPLERLFL
ncbi:tripartite tricarboxylate transporter TctB family protein [Oharaeibacter diazotrophicus]|uniref:Putative tricarboxylic transport membrane protein n=1 Tax=Oharaeibacter diazotrophicus TaxID=1920512 RepID=A0A4R6RL26_9HYPH|nr:tripartite tricarboxylate transporter TctB family protein [Oharaeibacter diazotrophicus]TDP87361.1 putative tricarboxylic transport membrane protein [Oharaeibacter diazotrophicus]BBE70695.1 tripartite tricarboxylate transporter TctB family protein [Pleomorphomonas sp. SM30]GLS77443.1 C4-dicarboxylate ABC transporter [Oharaeibacter diazotrophicus]